jgi:hypothetical protein
LGYFVPECKVEENFQSSIDSFEFSPLNEERNSNWRMSGSMEITGSVASLIDFDHIGKEYPQFLALRQQASLGMLESDFAASGSVVITAAVPSQDSLPSITIPVQTKPGILLGYIPPVIGFIPASNQVWGEIDRKTKTFTIHRGQSVIAEMPGQGDVPLNPGTYSVQHKLTRPKWYAPDSYFENRGLEVPADSQAPRARYRRGALGNYALYVTEDWAIHSSMEYSPEVGGFRVGQNDLASIYYLLPVGSSIKIK